MEYLIIIVYLNYGNPVPLIVSVVPPPVPPRCGLTELTDGVKADLYVKEAACTTLFELIVTVQLLSVVVTEEAGVFKIKYK